jgi:hypothetical protein
MPRFAGVEGAELLLCVITNLLTGTVMPALKDRVNACHWELGRDRV